MLLSSITIFILHLTLHKWPWWLLLFPQFAFGRALGVSLSRGGRAHAHTPTRTHC